MPGSGVVPSTDRDVRPLRRTRNTSVDRTPPPPPPSPGVSDDNQHDQEVVDVVPNQGKISTPSISHEGREDLFRVERTAMEIFRDGLVVSARFRVVPLEAFLRTASGTTLIELHDVIRAVFRSILDGFSRTCKQDDVIKLLIDQQSLDSPILVQPEEVGSLTLHSVMMQISSVLLSKRKLVIDDTFVVTVSIIRNITGGVSKIRLLLEEQAEVLYAKRSLIRVRNQDDTACLPRAIMLAWASRVRVDNEEFNRERRCGESMHAAMFRLRKSSKYLFKSMIDVRRPLSQDRGLKLMLELAHLQEADHFDLANIEPIEHVLHCAVHVISQIAGNKFVRLPCEAAKERGWTSVFIYHHREDPEDLLSPFHYDAISKLPAFFGVRAVCETCLKPRASVYVNCCREKCRKCLSKRCTQPSEEDSDQILCDSCNTTFSTQDCFERHKRSLQGQRSDAGSICSKRWTCTRCGKVFETCKRKMEEHVCGEYFCNSCEAYFTQRHECFVRVPQNSQAGKNRQDRVLIFFDIETRQTRSNQCASGTSLPTERCRMCQTAVFPCTECSRCVNCQKSTCGSLIHEANLVVAQKVCDECCDRPFLPDEICSRCGDRCFRCSIREKSAGIRDYTVPPCAAPKTCGVRQKIFFGEDCLKDFVNWLISDFHDGASTLAHNAAGYDNIFLLSELMKKEDLEPADVIFTGTKLLYIELRNPVHIRFLDNYKFMPFPLASLPKSFDLCMDAPGGISGQHAKGYFPHLFNTVENEDYIGPYPSPTKYSYREMKPQAAANFIKWHSTTVNQHPPPVFDFKKEIVQYCVNDVTILRLACLKFRALVQELTGVDAFDRCLTLPSLAITIFLSKFLTETLSVTIRCPVEDQAGHTNPDSNRTQVLEGCQRGGVLKVDRGDGAGYVDVEHLPAGSKVLKKHFKSTPIVRVPPGGYRRYNHGHSAIALQWLELCAVQDGRKIYHAGNWAEVGVLIEGGRTVYVDGFSPGDGRPVPMKSVLTSACAGDRVYSFYGCYWHCCETCYPLGRDVVKCSKTKRTFREIHQETMDRCRSLEEMGFVVVWVWEHEFRASLKHDSELRDRVEGLPKFQEPLDPRDSLYGGRTETFVLSFERSDFLPEGQVNDATLYPKLQYVDFTSLYPSVQKQEVFPLGHPIVVTEGFDLSLKSYFGVALAKVLPPRDLLFPVLPSRHGGKLIFALCRTCAERGSSAAVPEPGLLKCSCSDEERAFTGTWATPELMLAQDMGYEILQVFEVYHYPSTTGNTIDPFTGGAVDLFGAYVDLMLKIKTEASGYPPGCTSEEDRMQYIANFQAAEGVELDPAHIHPNPSKRSLAKLLLNSVWGKLSQKSMKRRSRIVNGQNPSELFDILTDPNVKLADFNIVDEDTLLLEYTPLKASLHSGPTDSVVLASFVTTYGRMRLYNLLNAAGKRALYADTDSLIYVANSPEEEFELGDFLGDLTSEIPPGTCITSFVATGPKSYAYLLSNGDSVLKYKGFTLSVEAGQSMNIEAMKRLTAEFRLRISERLAAAQTEAGSGDDEEGVCGEYGGGASAGAVQEQVEDEHRHEHMFDDAVDGVENATGIFFEASQPLQDPAATIAVANAHIFRMKPTMSVLTRKQVKRYTLNANKRVFLPDLTSVPYGYTAALT